METKRLSFDFRFAVKGGDDFKRKGSIGCDPINNDPITLLKNERGGYPDGGRERFTP